MCLLYILHGLENFFAHFKFWPFKYKFNTKQRTFLKTLANPHWFQILTHVVYGHNASISSILSLKIISFSLWGYKLAYHKTTNSPCFQVPYRESKALLQLLYVIIKAILIQKQSFFSVLLGFQHFLSIGLLWPFCGRFNWKRKKEKIKRAL